VRILVADDHAPTLRMLSARLKSWGMDPVLAANGDEAWEKLQSERLNLVISDWMMPRVDGVELCRRIRSADLGGYVYVILCTGKDEKSDLIAGLEAGADDFLSKPVDFDELRVALRAGTRVLELESTLKQKNQQLTETNVRLEQAYATIQEDLEAAAAMQAELLPRDRNSIPQLRLDWLFVPASYLAGDIFDYFRLADQRLAFYQLDVAGHGVPSALLSVSISRALLNAHRSGELMPAGGEVVPPEEVVSRLNRQFQNIGDMYFTIAYGVIDTQNHEVWLCQAGHPNPISIAADGSVHIHSKGGFPVGMIASMDYESSRIAFEPGSRLFVYSDGITDCRNPQQEAFGEHRLMSMLMAQRGATLSGAVAVLGRQVREWRGSERFEDDISLLAFEACAE
jgi:phosphoserine phosphatase RsbU/P